MSRSEDISFVESEISSLATTRQKIADDFSAYHAKIESQIEKLLREAEVWDLVQALSAGREKRKAEDQANADALGTKLADLHKVLLFLRSREGVEPVSPKIVNGVDVSNLDRETRLLVESGNQETINHLSQRDQ